MKENISEPNNATSTWRVDSQGEHAKIFRHMELHGLPDSVIDITATPSGAEPPPPCGSLRESMPVTETPHTTCAFRAGTWTAKQANTTAHIAIKTRRAGVTSR